MTSFRSVLPLLILVAFSDASPTSRYNSESYYEYHYETLPQTQPQQWQSPNSPPMTSPPPFVPPPASPSPISQTSFQPTTSQPTTFEPTTSQPSAPAPTSPTPVPVPGSSVVLSDGTLVNSSGDNTVSAAGSVTEGAGAANAGPGGSVLAVGAPGAGLAIAGMLQGLDLGQTPVA